MRHVILLATAGALALAAPPANAGDAPGQSVYTYAVELDADGKLLRVAPHAAAADDVGRALERDIAGWVFSPAGSGDVGAGSRTFVRVVVSPTGARGYEVVSATTGPAPETLTQPAFPVRDQLSDREGMVVLRLDVTADGRVAGARVHAVTGKVSRGMSAAAVSAAQGWTFVPEEVGGVPIAATMLWPVCYVGARSAPSACSWNGPDSVRFSSKTVLPLDPAVRLVSQAVSR
jgi:TonB family protein